MPADKADVEYVASLAKLKFENEEEIMMAEDLNSILSYFMLLDELDLTGVEPLYHILETHNITRPDEAKKPMPIEEALANAPHSEGRSFVLPKML